jgi:Na+/serine symporter
MRSRTAAWDAAVAAWVVGCLALAAYTGVEVSHLNDIGHTLVVSSRALDATAAAVERFKDVPFVGGDLGSIAAQISHTAESARASAASSRDTIDRVAILIAVAIFVIAVVPPVVAYIAVRRRLTAPFGAAP